MPNWFVLREHQPLSAAENMARDEVLFLRCHREKRGFLRLYSWDRPTFSFGVSQRIENAINEDYIRENRLAFVRRFTGGKAVLHDDEMTYAVASSEDVFLKNHDLAQSYLLISRIILDAFNRIGLPATLSGRRDPSLAKSSHPCFSFPTPNEIEIQGKKIVGSAQKRDKSALLQHGSIPFSMDYDRYARGTGSKPDIIADNMITLGEVSAVSRDVFADRLIQSFEHFVGEPLEAYEFDEQDRNEINRIAEKYRSESWNYRR